MTHNGLPKSTPMFPLGALTIIVHSSLTISLSFSLSPYFFSSFMSVCLPVFFSHSPSIYLSIYLSFYLSLSFLVRFSKMSSSFVIISLLSPLTFLSPTSLPSCAYSLFSFLLNHLFCLLSPLFSVNYSALLCCVVLYCTVSFPVSGAMPK